MKPLDSYSQDSQLQAYLDGRLDADQRRTFEQRLLAEPELAARLAEYRSLQSALKATNEEEPLPPGFYTRTREAFTESQRKPSRWGFRMLSWEALGLVAAAGLALALFGPGLVREELPLGPETSPVALQKSVTLDDVGKDLTEDLEDTVAGVAALSEDGPEEESELDGVAGDQHFAPVPERLEAREQVQELEGKQREQQPPGRPAAPATPAPSSITGGKPEAAKATAAPSPPADDVAEPQTRRRQAIVRRVENAPVPTESELVGERVGSVPIPTVPASAQPIEASPLPEGKVPAHAIRTLKANLDSRAFADRSTQAQAKRSDAGGKSDEASESVTPHSAALTLAESDRDAAGVRIVMLGPRATPISCVGVRVDVQDDRYRVFLGTVSPDRPVAPGGCSIHLPDDGRPVEVVHPYRDLDE